MQRANCTYCLYIELILCLESHADAKTTFVWYSWREAHETRTEEFACI